VIFSPHRTGLCKEAALRMAISTARNVLAGIDGKLDPSMVVYRERFEACAHWVRRGCRLPPRAGIKRRLPA
jgi:hypothetical protein